MGMCQVPIKKLKATNIKGVTSDLGGLNSHWRAHTFHIRVGGGIKLVVGGILVEI